MRASGLAAALVLSSSFAASASEPAARHLIYLHGRILSIREKSDETSEPCPPWSDNARSRATLSVRELVLETGLRHGFLHRPLPEWVEPVVEWSTRR